MIARGLRVVEVVDERLAIIPPMEERVQGVEEIEALIAQRNEAKKNRISQRLTGFAKS